MAFQNIIEVKPQGYCGGVINAIRKVEQLHNERPNEPITILGNLVHNDHVRQSLEKKGIQILEAKGKTRLELLDQIDEGWVVFTAHGISDAVMEKAAHKGLKILDASCRFVLTTKELVKEKLAEGYEVLYIGKQGHPEAEAIYTSSPHVHLITCKEDIPEHLDGPVFVTNQTTMSILEIAHLFEAIQKACPQAVINDEICNATRVRQQAILDLAGKGVDALIVVGDPSSNNTRQLEAIGHQAGIPEVFRIECARDLDLSLLPENGTIAITSGASTPTALKQQVLDLLSHPDLDVSVIPDALD